jgi:ribokinase
MITICGSVNVDLLFRVPALPRPGETVVGTSYAMAAGGKGANQAVAAARDGSKVGFYGCIGADDFGRFARDSLSAAHVDVGGLRRVAAPTGCATICVDAAGQNQIAVAAGANGEVHALHVPDAALAAGSALLLQMEIPLAEVAALLARAKARGCRTLLNLAPALPLDRQALAAADIVVVNEVEAETLAKRLGLASGEPVVLVRTLAAALANTVIVTLGAAGAVAAAADQAWTVGALTITAVDTTGAGDAFVGVLAAALDRGVVLPDALHRASVAGGLACLKSGAQPSFPTAGEIDARLSDLAPPRNLP